ncbi:hypothetical protein [Streptomyces sp. NPDC048057]|uniref:hypothetical protein n=1 Tax=Streptomyces sp. NPDC048057 TaxID=3155628 RepID=UPI0033CB815C
MAAGPHIRPPQVRTLRRKLNLTDDELAQQAAAWRYAGQAGHRTRTEPWNPPGTILAAALGEIIPLLTEAGHPQTVSIDSNRITCGNLLHLRYGPDHQWHPYQPDGETPAGPPRATPSEALRHLLARPAEPGRA